MMINEPPTLIAVHLESVLIRLQLLNIVLRLLYHAKPLSQFHTNKRSKAFNSTDYSYHRSPALAFHILSDYFQVN